VPLLPAAAAAVEVSCWLAAAGAGCFGVLSAAEGAPAAAPAVCQPAAVVRRGARQRQRLIRRDRLQAVVRRCTVSAGSCRPCCCGGCWHGCGSQAWPAAFGVSGRRLTGGAGHVYVCGAATTMADVLLLL
ncbi:hypothetical protein COO60DRAFT_1543554, partial [Scenedesmus sp. NREL 46B-D3]